VPWLDKLSGFHRERIFCHMNKAVKSATPAKAGKLVKRFPAVTYTNRKRPKKTMDGIPFEVANARQNEFDRDLGKSARLILWLEKMPKADGQGLIEAEIPVTLHHAEWVKLGEIAKRKGWCVTETLDRVLANTLNDWTHNKEEFL
jgi:hypothetical protein